MHMKEGHIFATYYVFALFVPLFTNTLLLYLITAYPAEITSEDNLSERHIGILAYLCTYGSATSMYDINGGTSCNESCEAAVYIAHYLPDSHTHSGTALVVQYTIYSYIRVMLS